MVSFQVGQAHSARGEAKAASNSKMAKRVLSVRTSVLLANILALPYAEG
jgi:hypothetical protein